MNAQLDLQRSPGDTSLTVIKYEEPSNWLNYDKSAITEALIEARAAVISAQRIPYQKTWVEELRKVQLKREIAGTSKIEGADFTDKELDMAISQSTDDSPEGLTRSQKQAWGATRAYRWLSNQIPKERPIDAELIRAVHYAIVKDVDDDHCPPGQLRARDQNVSFGVPIHRGAEGGAECEKAFNRLCHALQHEFKDEHFLIQALAFHYHFAAIHPFLDGNGRTARAVASVLLQRAGLRDVCFIPLSNYYYDNKNSYLTTMSEVRARGHDLTPFLIFSLKGIAEQSQRLIAEIQTYLSKALFRNLAHELFTRLRSPRKRVILDRQLRILEVMLNKDDSEGMELWSTLYESVIHLYHGRRNPHRAFIRDINNLIELNAVWYKKIEPGIFKMHIRLDWPTIITETEFFQKVRGMAKAKSTEFLSGG